MFSLTSLGTKWAGSLATEQQWLTLSIIQLLTRIGWSIKTVFWHRWQFILHWLSGVEWYPASTILASYALSCGSISGPDWFLTLIIGFLPYSKWVRQHLYSHLIHTLTLGIWFLIQDSVRFSNIFPEFAAPNKMYWLWNTFIYNSWLFPPALGQYLQVHCSESYNWFLSPQELFQGVTMVII